ncbi:MAG: biotin/lipoyl-binding protein [Ruminococcus sp.]|nr:biotin/lipoyl-binding protein [Ruminococcus sp.]
MKKRFMTVALAALCLCTAALSGCSDEEASEEIQVPILEEGDISFETVSAEIGTISETYTLDGSYENPYLVTVSSSVSGKVQSMSMENGASVEEGDVLMTITSDEIDQEIEEQQIRLDSAQQTYNTLASTADITSAELESAKIDIEIEQNEMDRLEAIKDSYSIKATASGKISLETGYEDTFAVGKNVNDGQYICTISPDGGNVLCARTNTSEALTDVNFGTTATVTNLNSEVGSGTVSDIIYKENGDYSNYCYVIDLKDDADLSYYDNLKVTLTAYTKENVVLVPTDAIRTISDESYVDVLIDGVKVQTAVETGIVGDSQTEIVSGLTGEEEIITG